MNCQQFDQIAVDLARACPADAAAQEGALEHAQSCPRCAARLSDQRKLTVALRAVSAAAGNAQAPARVEQNLLGEYRMRFDASRRATAGRSGSQSAPTAWRFWAATVAAMLLLALVAAWRLRPNSHARPVEPASSQQGTHKEAEKAAAARGGETRLAPAVVRHVVPRPALTAKRGTPSKRFATPEQTAATEATTRFYPLPYGSGLGLDEGWALVRVQVRRSSLASLGVPFNAGPAAGEMLTADVVVGQDGLARGIRFVQ